MPLFGTPLTPIPEEDLWEVLTNAVCYLEQSGGVSTDPSIRQAAEKTEAIAFVKKLLAASFAKYSFRQTFEPYTLSHNQAIASLRRVLAEIKEIEGMIADTVYPEAASRLTALRQALESACGDTPSNDNPSPNQPNADP